MLMRATVKKQKKHRKQAVFTKVPATPDLPQQLKRVQQLERDQELYARNIERQRLGADMQLQADLRQLNMELVKMIAMMTAVAQQVLEAAERYRKARE